MNNPNRFSSDYRQFDRQTLVSEAEKTVRAGMLGSTPPDAKATDVVADESEEERLTRILSQLREEAVGLPDLPDVEPITPEALTREGLTSDQVERMRPLFNSSTYFLLPIPLTLFPRRGWSFDRVECQITFNPQDPIGGRPVVHSVFPSPREDLLAALDMGLDFGVNEKLRFTVASNGDMGAEGGTTGKLAFSFPVRRYLIKRATINSDGEGTSETFWRLSDPEYVNGDRPTLAVIVRIPEEIQKFKASGILVAYRSLKIWGADLDVVWDYFTRPVKEWFEAGTPAGCERTWDFTSRLLHVREK